MKIFFDTEFTELSKKAELISIGMIDENDNSFYAELNDYNIVNLDKWVKENVIANLLYNNHSPFNKIKRANDHTDVIVKGNKEDVKKHLSSWFSNYSIIELVTDVGHYDMVLLVDIFGTAMDLPKNIAPTYFDINQMIADYYHIGLKEAFDISRENLAFNHEPIDYENKHNAMWDAYVIKKIWQKLQEK